MTRSLTTLLRNLCVLSLLFASATVAARPPVEVTGLFKNQAYLRIQGTDRLVRVGDTSPEGVTLVKASATSATIRFRGETHVLSLTDRVGGSFREPERVSVSLPPDGLGQYRVRGTINNQLVPFLVDTGASVVAMSAPQAQALGLSYTRGQRGIVETAQGRTEAYFISLREVNIGGVKAYNVAATVIDGNYPSEVLLGTSYLNQVDMTNRGGVMLLQAR